MHADFSNGRIPTSPPPKVPKIEWSDELCTGDPEIDEHHREFVARAQRLVAACAKGEGDREIDAALVLLDREARSHFAREEAEMKRTGYPYVRTHWSSHRVFLQRLEELVRMSRKSSDKNAVALVAAVMVSDWFTHHINVLDRALGEHLKKH